MCQSYIKSVFNGYTTLIEKLELHGEIPSFFFRKGTYYSNFITKEFEMSKRIIGKETIRRLKD